MDNKECLMIPIMKAASDLILSYNTTLNDKALIARMKRISDDLLYAIEECDSNAE